MAVNESIYGSSENWRDVYYFLNSQTPKNKKAYFAANQSQLAQGVTAGKLSYSTPIDKTLSYCGLGAECALSNIVYYQRSGTDVTEKETENRFQTNFAFSEKTDTTHMYFSANDPTLGGTDNNKYNDWQTTRDTFNQTPWLEPYTKILPKNICLLIRVKCKATTSSGTLQDYDLSTYLASHTTTKKYIQCVYVEQYNGSETYRRLNGDKSTSTYNIPFNIATLDGYTVNSETHYAYNLSENIVFGALFKSGSRWDSGYMPVYYTENSKSHTTVTAYNSGGIYYCNVNIEYYPEFEQDILKTVACFGLYFTPKISVATGGTLTNTDMYIGILDENGIGHGDYLRGTDTANAPQNNYSDMSQTGYDYTKEVDKTKYRNDTQFYAGYGTSSFTKFYALTETQVNELSQELYRIANDVPSGTSITEYNMKMFLTNNPIDCIISLKKFPVENIPLATTDATIYLGAKSTNITGKILATPTWVYYFNFRNSANQSCRPIFGDNFLDYEPYTKCKIVIPFCGTVDVPVSYIYQYDDLQIALVMDFITGAVTAFILVNGITIDSITGSCAIDLPVSGIQSATLDSQIHSVAMAREKQQTTLGTGLIAGAVSIGIGLATGNLPAAIGGGAAIIGSFLAAEDKGKQINYDLTHMQTPVKQVSAASGQIAHTYDMRCKMVITRPEIAAEYSAEEYSKTIGFACLENGEVQNFHGLTVANIDLSGINCTAEEKNMIRAAFANGVYLPAEYSENYWT